MISVSAIIQITILYLVIYAILRSAKGSRFGQALMGFGIIATLLIAFAYLFRFDVLTRIVQFLLAYIAVSTVVIFQPEIRRILSAVGARIHFAIEGAAMFRYYTLCSNLFLLAACAVQGGDAGVATLRLASE